MHPVAPVVLSCLPDLGVGSPALFADAHFRAAVIEGFEFENYQHVIGILLRFIPLIAIKRELDPFVVHDFFHHNR